MPQQKQKPSSPGKAAAAVTPSKGPNAGITSALYFDANTYKYWLVIVLSGVLTHLLLFRCLTFLWLFLTLFFAVVLSFVADFLYYFLGWQYYDPSKTIVRGYSASAYFNESLHSVGLDYGFNYYNGDYKKSRAQAQKDKFEYAIAQLGIKRGDRVIDVGCGCGDWLNYLKTEWGCSVVGINITDAQADQARKRGLQVFTSDWKHIAPSKNGELAKLLFGQFDFVTFWDTVEHYVPFGFGLWNREGRAGIYQDMFALAKNLLDEKNFEGNAGARGAGSVAGAKRGKGDALKNRVWISCLHNRFELFPSNWLSQMAGKLFKGQAKAAQITDVKKGKFDTDPVLAVNDWSFAQCVYKWYCIYLLDKFHSGYYPSYYQQDGEFHDELVDNGKAQGFDLVWRKDTTLDYYMTSQINPTHFGRHRLNFGWFRILVMCVYTLVDPFWLHHILWYNVEAWMEQFEPDNMKQSMTILWWMVLELELETESK